jgi:PAS domain S-box-containing protein
MSQTIRALVIDDEVDLCYITKEFLERNKDLEVDIADSVARARTALVEKHYDVIVSDYQMPSEDGIQFLRSLRSSQNSVPFILFTGKGREEVVIQALNSGADSYLQKGGQLSSIYAEMEHHIRVAVGKRRAEEALRKRDEQLALVIEGASMGTWDWQVQTGACEYNERWAEIAGYALAELSPASIDTWADLIHKEDIARSNDLLQKNLSGDRPMYEVEVRVLHKDGHWVWVLDSGKVVERDGAGRPIRMTGTRTDISEKKGAEEMLRQTMAELRRFNTLTVDREHRMIELKKEVNVLLRNAGKDERYRAIE